MIPSLLRFSLFGLLLWAATALQAAQRLTRTELSMQQQGMVDVQTIDSTIRVSLMYSRPDNFMGRTLYEDLHRAFLHPRAARALVMAQRYLKEEHPEWSLIVMDACRPMHIQQMMWDKVKGTPVENYVSNPARGGGLHNYGMAVDITICTERGDTIEMGSLVDHMSALSHIDREAQLVQQKKMTARAAQNRQLLRRIMRKAGFKPLRSEWWHFNLIYREEAKRNYRYVK